MRPNRPAQKAVTGSRDWARSEVELFAQSGVRVR